MYFFRRCKVKRILIVDDSRVSRKILKNMLEANGYEVVGEAVNGKEGVELFEKLSPDIITMDITMPELNGIEALKQIREQSDSVKVVIITAAGQKEKRIEAQECGANEFVTKPYVKGEILDAVNRCLI